LREKPVFWMVPAVLFLICLLQMACTQQERKPLMQTYEAYIQSVQNRDLNAMIQTITDNDALHFIGTTGKMLETREEYVEFHRDWFSEEGWDISFELDKIFQENDFGYVMAIFTYHQDMPDGKRMTLVSYVTLVFHWEHQSWRAIADVCTPISRDID